jgi:hypothetical protein
VTHASTKRAGYWHAARGDRGRLAFLVELWRAGWRAVEVVVEQPLLAMAASLRSDSS